MSHFRLSIGPVCLCLALAICGPLIPVASAQYVNSPDCLKETYDALAHEKRLERSVLFGQKKSADLPTGSVRFDTDGNTWLKKTANQWRSISDADGGGIDNGEMDDRTDVPARRGIFETRRAPASDLIPAITQTFRAYQCRLYAVCAAAQKSRTTALPIIRITVQPDGCIESELPVMRSCRNGTQLNIGADTCPQIVRAMLDEEEQLLLLAEAYDASYRTLMQFEGVFEGFLSDFRFPLIDPLWQTVRAIGGFAHMPCFLSQCDE